MPKLQEAKNGQFRLTIPYEIVKAKGWSKGQRLAVYMLPNGDISLKEI